MKRKALFLLCAVLAAGTVMYGCGLQRRNTTSSKVSESAPQTESQTSSEIFSEPSQQPVNDKMTFINTAYETDKIMLDYPMASQMDDTAVEEKVNQLIEKNNQLASKQYNHTANLKGKAEVAFCDGETLSVIYHWTLTNEEENTGYPAAYQHSLVIDLKTGEQQHLHEYASVYHMYDQLKYGLYDSQADAEVRVTVQNLLRNGTISINTLETADYPLSETFPPTMFGYVTQDKIGLLINVPDNMGDSLSIEFDRKDVAKIESIS